MFEVKIEGTERLISLGKTLRELGDKGKDGVLPTLRRSINQDTKEARRRIRDTIRTRSGLPQSGGLAKWAGRMPSTSTHVQSDRASITLKLAKRGHDFVSLDKGEDRHPVWGNRKVWVSQSVASGWWEKAVRPEADAMFDQVQKDIDAAVLRAIDKFGRGGGL